MNDDCKKSCSIRAGTFFDKSKLSLQQWLGLYVCNVHYRKHRFPKQKSQKAWRSGPYKACNCNVRIIYPTLTPEEDHLLFFCYSLKYRERTVSGYGSPIRLLRLSKS